jgi:phage terminase large subunit GpA-like protein
MSKAAEFQVHFQPAPPPCVGCGTTTVIAPALEEGQRAFVVRCPACGRAGTYSLNYSTMREW